MPIHFRNTARHVRREYIKHEEAKLQRRFDAHTCRDDHFCPLSVLEDVMREHIAKALNAQGRQ